MKTIFNVFFNLPNAIIVFVTLICSHKLSSQNFNGLYAGVSVGRQNIFGGSYINGVDILSRDTRFAIDLNAGYRIYLVSKRLVFGPEVSFGYTDGNLQYNDPDKILHINYKNDKQWCLGGVLGVALGKNNNCLVFLYLNEVKRKFIVSIRDAKGSYTQRDKQGMLRYGLGVEFPIINRLHTRISIGSGRADFGELITNINVNHRIDINGGLIIQF